MSAGSGSGSGSASGPDRRRGRSPVGLDTGKIAAARLWAANRFPYLASALFASPVVAADALGRFAVDRWWRLYVDPEVLAAATVPQVGFELVHHCGHLLRDHAGRAGDMPLETPADVLAWVAAGDAEINDDLTGPLAGDDLADVAPAQDPILPSSLGCAPGRLAEEYFRPATSRCEGGLHPSDCGSGAHGRRRAWELADDGAGLRPYQGDLVRWQVANDVLAHAQQAGTLPAGMLRWAEQLAAPRVDWRRALAAELRRGVADTTGRTDYTYRRPSRRAAAVPDVVLPALRRPVPQVAVVCDTSGSMTGELLGRVVAEVDGILRGVGVRAEGVRVLACDAAAHTAQRVRHAGQIELIGGGGTDMGAGIAAAVAGKPKPDVVVVLTDGYTPWPASGPKGTRVVVGLLRAGGGGLGVGPGAGAGAFGPPPPPRWARTITIDDPAPLGSTG
jgi:predicted metal-dependent peptidase